jgi:hypothetical protein
MAIQRLDTTQEQGNWIEVCLTGKLFGSLMVDDESVGDIGKVDYDNRPSYNTKLTRNWRSP